MLLKKILYFKACVPRLFFVFGASLVVQVSPSQAQNWILLEARELPGQCTRPLSCVNRSTLVLHNLLNVSPTDRNVLFQTLNQISTIRGIPEDLGATSVMSPENVTPVLQSLPMAEKNALLVNHPGVYFDPAALDTNELTAGFSAVIIEELAAAGVRFLSEEEWERTPGRPTLSVRFTGRRESAGCIIPFSISMSISEETVMVRNPTLKTKGSTWSGQVKENLANLNYTPQSALIEILEKFTTDWRVANP